MSIQKKVVIAALILIPLIGLRVWIGNRQVADPASEKPDKQYEDSNSTKDETRVSDNLKQLLQQLTAATNKQNLQAALQIVHLMQRHVKTEADKQYLQGAVSFVRGLFAFYKREYPQATHWLLDARKRKVIWSNRILAQSCVQLSHQYWAARKDREALKIVRLARQLAPNDLIVVYNAGVTEWYALHQSGKASSTDNWKKALQAFEKHAAGNTNIPLNVVYIAQSILNGSYNQRPPLLRPQEPAAKFGKIVDALRNAEAAAIQKAKAQKKMGN